MWGPGRKPILSLPPSWLWFVNRSSENKISILCLFPRGSGRVLAGHLVVRYWWGSLQVLVRKLEADCCLERGHCVLGWESQGRGSWGGGGGWLWSFLTRDRWAEFQQLWLPAETREHLGRFLSFHEKVLLSPCVYLRQLYGVKLAPLYLLPLKLWHSLFALTPFVLFVCSWSFVDLYGLGMSRQFAVKDSVPFCFI